MCCKPQLTETCSSMLSWSSAQGDADGQIHGPRALILQ